MNSAQQTYRSFYDKWEKNKDLAFSETLREGSDIYSWILNWNGFKSTGEFQRWLSNKNKILDAGCGNGRVTALLRKHSPESTKITGIDLTSAHIAEKNLNKFKNLEFKQFDLLDDLRELGSFDLIYCQEVLHHTLNPEQAFKNLCSLLTVGGEIAIYVYKLKAPSREFCDEFIRNEISNLPYEKSMKVMQEITDFGMALHNTDKNVTVPNLEVMGIKGGTYSIQRLIYHFFMKCFWNPDLDFDANAAINYDWYHPQLCSKHSLEEVEDWFIKNELSIKHTNVDHYGITLRGTKEKSL